VGGVDALPGPAVRTVPVGDHEAMAGAILGLLGDDAEHARAADAARAAAARFAPEACHAAYAALYSELTA
jgi:glycosyltransferase involved in cell wall biosynthesis